MKTTNKLRAEASLRLFPPAFNERAVEVSFTFDLTRPNNDFVTL